MNQDRSLTLLAGTVQVGTTCVYTGTPNCHMGMSIDVALDDVVSKQIRGSENVRLNVSNENFNRQE